VTYNQIGDRIEDYSWFREKEVLLEIMGRFLRYMRRHSKLQNTLDKSSLRQEFPFVLLTITSQRVSW